MDTLTPLQCFAAGLALSLFIIAALGLLAWRRIAELRARDPEAYLAAFEKERQRQEKKALLEETAYDLRQREMELLERIAKNQEVMIDLLRQSLGEQALS